MKKIVLAQLLAFLFACSLSAQQIVPCVTDETHYQMKQANPQIAIDEERGEIEVQRKMEALLNNGNLRKMGTVIYIPVVFHVIHNDGMENITQAQIMDQIRILNEDFRKKEGTNGAKSTDPLAVDMEYEFRLAQVDPNGNRHDGINRIKNVMTENARDNVKALIQWPPTKYLNIWVVKSIESGSSEGTVLGFAQFPSSLSTSPSTDGIVIRADYVGNIQTGNSSNAGRTLTHEVGHWIGLFHTFQGGCVGNLSGNCASQGDRVCDTPPVESATFGCLTSRNSCTNDSPDNNDMIANYMDYMDGSCANTYTPGQKARSIAQMSTFRSVIYSTANLQASGIDAVGNYLPVAASTLKAPYSYGFEDADITTAGWRIENLNNGANAWDEETVPFSGVRSIGFRNNDIASTVLLNSRDGFNSPLIDLSTVANPQLTFKVAYSRRATGTNDIFDLGISGDFGRTETRIFRGTGGTLETQSPSTTAFVPTQQSQWRTITIDLSAYQSMTNARFRFEFINRKGNNIFVDDFVITTATGVNETLKKDLSFNVFPNPMSDVAYAQFELKQSTHMKITVCDLTGRSIRMIQSGSMQAGMYSLPIDKGQLGQGIYLIMVETENGTFAHKLAVN